MAEFKLDLARHERIGLDEAIFCAGKTADQIAAILDSFPAGGGLFLTRLDGPKFEALPARLRSALDYEPLSRTAILGAPRPARAGAPVAAPVSWTELRDLDTAARWGVRDGAALLARANGRGLQGWGVADQVLPDL